jgi:hypothetical protein
LVVEECLSLVKERHPQIHEQGLVDDLGFYGSGSDLEVVTNQMQDAINTVSNWCKSVDLSVDQKVGLMLITNRHQTKTDQNFDLKRKETGVHKTNQVSWNNN